MWKNKSPLLWWQSRLIFHFRLELATSKLIYFLSREVSNILCSNYFWFHHSFKQNVFLSLSILLSWPLLLELFVRVFVLLLSSIRYTQFVFTIRRFSELQNHKHVNFAKNNKRSYLHNDHSTTKLGHFPVHNNDIQIIRMLRIQP